MHTGVAYYRVSTRKQGISGLGLEAQEAAVEQYCRQQDARIVRGFQEVESGGNCQRLELRKAIGFARRCQGKLVVAKLDRLSRDVFFVSQLMRSGVDFVCCDMPDANPFTIHIWAALAEQERRMASARTKAAMQAYKERGGKIGGRRLTDADREKGRAVARESRRLAAVEAYEDLREELGGLLVLGYANAAKVLNLRGYKTRRGAPWRASTVQRVCNYLGVTG